MEASSRLTGQQRFVRLIAIACIAALIAGSVTGSFLVLRDPVWPERGGMEAVIQASLLFSGYALLIALPVGFVLARTLSPLLARSRVDHPLLHLAIGLLVGLVAHLLVDLAIGERIDSAEDFIGGTIAGGVAGLLWWFSVQRHERKGMRHG